MKKFTYKLMSYEECRKKRTELKKGYTKKPDGKLYVELSESKGNISIRLHTKSEVTILFKPEEDDYSTVICAEQKEYLGFYSFTMEEIMKSGGGKARDIFILAAAGEFPDPRFPDHVR